MEAIRIGTRGSALARWQAESVVGRLAELGIAGEITIIQVSGDAIVDRPLSQSGGKGLFTKEIESALLDNRIDCAAHSLKDVPAEVAPGCRLAAVLEREDARDVLVAPPGMRLPHLAAGARVGTGSLRRRAQLLALRSDVDVLPLRGNVDSRLRRWLAGEFDALILAGAGLKRLEHTAVVAEWIAPEQMCPAAGQGAIALECRGDDTHTLAILRKLNHAPSEAATNAERALIRALGCGCQSPVGAHAWWEDAELRLRAVVASGSGDAVLRTEAGAQGRSPEHLGTALAAVLRAQGAEAILAEPAAGWPKAVS